MDSPTNIQVDQHAGPQEKIKSTIDELITKFSEDCQRLNIEHGVMIIRDPESNNPKIYLHGHLYDVGVLIGGVYDKVKQELFNKLR